MSKSNKIMIQVCLCGAGTKKAQAPTEAYNGIKGKATRVMLKGLSKSVEKDSDILWNFTKFLVNRDGTVIKRYAPITTPEEIEKDLQGML